MFVSVRVHYLVKRAISGFRIKRSRVDPIKVRTKPVLKHLMENFIDWFKHMKVLVPTVPKRQNIVRTPLRRPRPDIQHKLNISLQLGIINIETVLCKRLRVVINVKSVVRIAVHGSQVYGRNPCAVFHLHHDLTVLKRIKIIYKYLGTPCIFEPLHHLIGKVSKRQHYQKNSHESENPAKLGPKIPRVLFPIFLLIVLVDEHGKTNWGFEHVHLFKKFQHFLFMI